MTHGKACILCKKNASLGGLRGSTACLRAEVHKDGQRVKGGKGSGLHFGQVRAQLLVRCPLEPRDNKKSR